MCVSIHPSKSILQLVCKKPTLISYTNRKLYNACIIGHQSSTVTVEYICQNFKLYKEKTKYLSKNVILIIFIFKEIPGAVLLPCTIYFNVLQL